MALEKQAAGLQHSKVSTPDPGANSLCRTGRLSSLKRIDDVELMTETYFLRLLKAQFMWQADLYGVARFITYCLGVYYDTDPSRGQASDQP